MQRYYIKYTSFIISTITAERLDASVNQWIHVKRSFNVISQYIHVLCANVIGRIVASGNSPMHAVVTLRHRLH